MKPSPRRNTEREPTAAPSTYKQVVRELAAVADPRRAAFVARYFKAGKGEYGEGDRFLGIPVPVLRRTALRYRNLPFGDLHCLLASPIHDHRAAALEILVAQYERGDENLREKVVSFYLRHTRAMNNWDLVDTAAPYILGEHFKTRPRRLLDRLAASRNLWERRIAIISTLALIGGGEIGDTFRITEKLLADEHDLIHKAAGWALRETGKVSRPALVAFLRKHYSDLPRTTLRYAIECFPAAQRKRMLAGKFS